MKRQLRYSLRALICLPFLAALAILIFDRVWVEDLSQHGTELVVISIVEAETGDPVSGAVLHSSDKAKEPNPKTTDAAGQAAFAHSYKYTHFKSLLRDERNHVVSHEIEIEASGYKGLTLKIESFRGGRSKKFSLPHPIVVRLARSGDAAASVAMAGEYSVDLDDTVSNAGASSSGDAGNDPSRSGDPFGN